MEEYLPIHIDQKDVLYNKIKDIPKFKKNIKNILAPFLNKNQKSFTIYEDKWKICKKKCYSILKKWVDYEETSTIYMLRILYFSILSFKKKKIEFKINGILTGIWEKDYKNIDFKMEEDKKPRLIFGFGPSGSGKTFHIKNMIELFRKKDKNFPSIFLSIDGGLFREYSVIYQTIVNELEKNYIGFKNLSLPSIYTYTHYYNLIFKTDKIKSSLIQYLLYKKIRISLYVPETLGDCGEKRIKDCYKKIKKYIQITNDLKWIGVFIWQHKYSFDCNFIPDYKCKGCTDSGKEREVKEGKLYSNSSYEHSYKEGLKMMLKSPSYRIFLHNSGKRDKKSILVNFSEKLKINKKDIDDKKMMLVSKKYIKL